MKLNPKEMKNALSVLLNYDKIADFIFEYTIGLVLKDKDLRARVGDIIIEFATGNVKSGYFKSYRLFSDSKMREILMQEFENMANDTSRLAGFIFALLGNKVNLLYERVIKRFGINVYEASKLIFFQFKDTGGKTMKIVIDTSSEIIDFFEIAFWTAGGYFKQGADKIFRLVKGLFGS